MKFFNQISVHKDSFNHVILEKGKEFVNLRYEKIKYQDNEEHNFYVETGMLFILFYLQYTFYK